ncbi:MAG: hypothetical protein HeimC2_00280 [Candidatus Heimdallarchaeota archaeon LC_2]|nr:MAG: hypothetical protein HeimC2_00280 [Candidatus Heimdallarchaeota archaeon LC_2]
MGRTKFLLITVIHIIAITFIFTFSLSPVVDGELVTENQQSYIIELEKYEIHISPDYTYSDLGELRDHSLDLNLRFYQYKTENEEYQVVLDYDARLNELSGNSVISEGIFWHGYQLYNKADLIRNVTFPEPFGGGEFQTDTDDHLVTTEPLVRSIDTIEILISTKIQYGNNTEVYLHLETLHFDFPGVLIENESFLSGIKASISSLLTNFSLIRSSILSLGILGIFFASSGSSKKRSSFQKDRIKTGVKTVVSGSTTISLIARSDITIPWIRYLITYFAVTIMLGSFSLFLTSLETDSETENFFEKYLIFIILIGGVFLLISITYLLNGVLSLIKSIFDTSLIYIYQEDMIDRWHALVFFISLFLNVLLVGILGFNIIKTVSFVYALFIIASLFIFGLILQGIIITYGLNGYYQNDLVFNTRKIVSKFSSNETLSLIVGIIMAVIILFQLFVNLTILIFTIFVIADVEISFLQDAVMVDLFVNRFNEIFMAFLLNDPLIFVFAVIGQLFGTFAFYIDHKNRSDDPDTIQFYCNIIPILIFGNVLTALVGILFFMSNISIGIAAIFSPAFVEFEFILDAISVYILYLLALITVTTAGQIAGLGRLRDGLHSDLEDEQLD